MLMTKKMSSVIDQDPRVEARKGDPQERHQRRAYQKAIARQEWMTKNIKKTKRVKGAGEKNQY